MNTNEPAGQPQEPASDLHLGKFAPSAESPPVPLADEGQTLFFRRVAGVLQVPPPRRVLPPAAELLLGPLAMLAEVVRPTGALSRASCLLLFRHRFHDAARARRELGWEPRVSLEEAVADAMRFYAGQGES